MDTSIFVGQPVLIRSNLSGVHVGVCLQHEGTQVLLKDAVRLYSWKAKQGVALSGVARHGLESGKTDSPVPLHMIGDVIEIILCAAGVHEEILK